MDKELSVLLKRAKEHKMTAEEIVAQRIGFAFGNAPRGNQNTKAEVEQILTQQTVTKEHAS